MKENKDIRVAKLQKVYNLLIKPHLTSNNYGFLTVGESLINKLPIVTITTSDYYVSTAISKVVENPQYPYGGGIKGGYVIWVGDQDFNSYCRTKGLGDNVFALISQLSIEEQREAQGFTRY